MQATRRKPGVCQDCGWNKPVRVVTFWATGFLYQLCADCEKPYRNVINWPVTEWWKEPSARARAEIRIETRYADAIVRENAGEAEKNYGHRREQ